MDPFVEESSDLEVDFLLDEQEPLVENAFLALLHLAAQFVQICVKQIFLPNSKAPHESCVYLCPLLKDSLKFQDFLRFLVRQRLSEFLVWKVDFFKSVSDFLLVMVDPAIKVCDFLFEIKRRHQSFEVDVLLLVK